MIAGLTITLVILLIMVDQLSKVAIALWLPQLDTAPILPGVLQFHYAENTGMAFGMLRNGRVFFIIVTSVVILVGLYIIFSRRLKNPVAYFSVAFMVAGGAGNLIDRIFRGYVIDFIEPIFMKFAIFNFADCLVTVGACGLIGYLVYDLYKDHKLEKKEKTQQEKRARGE